MPRPLRIEYPDAWYHVMNRGRRDEDIFLDDQDYVMFTELLKEKDKVSEKVSGKKWPVCLGPQSFIDRIKETYGADTINRDVPSSRELLPDKQRILEVVCKSYDISASDILKMRRGKMKEARNAAIYLTRRLRRDTLKEIGAQFGIDNDSTVSSVMERMKKRLAEDRKLSLQLDKIAESIAKS